MDTISLIVRCRLIVCILNMASEQIQLLQKDAALDRSEESALSRDNYTIEMISEAFSGYAEKGFIDY